MFSESIKLDIVLPKSNMNIPKARYFDHALNQPNNLTAHPHLRPQPPVSIL